MRIYELFNADEFVGAYRTKEKAQRGIDRLARIGRDTSKYKIISTSVPHADLSAHLEQRMKRPKQR